MGTTHAGYVGIPYTELGKYVGLDALVFGEHKPKGTFYLDEGVITKASEAPQIPHYRWSNTLGGKDYVMVNDEQARVIRICPNCMVFVKKGTDA